MGFLPTYAAEAQIYAQYILENHPRSGSPSSIRTTAWARSI